jgi:hypothetical protein
MDEQLARGGRMGRLDNYAEQTIALSLTVSTPCGSRGSSVLKKNTGIAPN